MLPLGLATGCTALVEDVLRWAPVGLATGCTVGVEAVLQLVIPLGE